MTNNFTNPKYITKTNAIKYLNKAKELLKSNDDIEILTAVEYLNTFKNFVSKDLQIEIINTILRLENNPMTRDGFGLKGLKEAHNYIANKSKIEPNIHVIKGPRGKPKLVKVSEDYLINKPKEEKPNRKPKPETFADKISKYNFNEADMPTKNIYEHTIRKKIFFIEQTKDFLNNYLRKRQEHKLSKRDKNLIEDYEKHKFELLKMINAELKRDSSDGLTERKYSGLIELMDSMIRYEGKRNLMENILVHNMMRIAMKKNEKGLKYKGITEYAMHHIKLYLTKYPEYIQFFNVLSKEKNSRIKYLAKKVLKYYNFKEKPIDPIKLHKEITEIRKSIGKDLKYKPKPK